MLYNVSCSIVTFECLQRMVKFMLYKVRYGMSFCFLKEEGQLTFIDLEIYSSFHAIHLALLTLDIVLSS
jgi:hypothetical protein